MMNINPPLPRRTAVALEYILRHGVSQTLNHNRLHNYSRTRSDQELLRSQIISQTQQLSISNS
jgi:hypothetical protein